MARLRLFAGLREAAGTASAELPGDTVADVIAAAVHRFGPVFEMHLQSARVWVNGEPAVDTTPVTVDDELALIPPVSGGAMVVRSPAGMEAALVLAVAAVLFLANAISVQWVAVSVVLAAGVWAFDLADVAGRRGLAVGAIPMLASILGAVLATYRFGIPGMAGAAVGGGLAGLAWCIAAPGYRSVESVATTALASVLAAVGSAAIVLLRLRSEDELLAFLVVVSLASAGSLVADYLGAGPIDPHVVGILGAVVGGLLAGIVWLDDLWATLVASGGVAMALVAGRHLGAMVRSGGFPATGPVPGTLHFFDGLLPAAGVFWLLADLLF